MISLFISLALLILGYIVYGRLVERIFVPDDRETPAIAVNDGVDCVPMKTWKAYLIANLTPSYLGNTFWIVVILAYYTFAAIVPIDKLIGRLCPCSRSARCSPDSISTFCGDIFRGAIRLLQWSLCGWRRHIS